ncbi:Site-specific recombinase XerD [Roseovarius azorensis]|uniref:Site-specific recombinase XerD n=1 Tax=Roseovarius azorensis TaxID=1287727 RepID=A0A1H7V8G7_9RHOB|nr:DUF6538 domain-containing protein [Roseovarius azorensis]SEM05486.1 Site-specific recombinase XerD [Roseovarius azorensis]
MTLKKIGKTYHLRRRVPKRFAAIEPRELVSQSLHTDSEQLAKLKADAAWAELIEGWEARLAGDTDDAERRFEAARELAERRGFRYLPVAKVTSLPETDLLERIEAVPEHKGEPNMAEAAALLGGVSEPPVTVSRALALYWGLAKDKTLGKSEDQLRRWENPRKKAVANFIAVVGDKPLPEITGDDMLTFRDWWIDRIADEDLTPNSANKDLIHLGDVLKTVNRMKRLGLVLPLSDLSLKEGEAAKRPPFSVAWIRDHLLKPGALDGLNEEARAILLVMVNTGCRPSEIAALTPETIHLSANVPHISIEPVGRQLKSRRARRKIALTGVSLEAMRRFPNGFPRYRDKSGLSGAVNKFLRENGLLETDSHSLYSLRHSFEDRLMAAKVDERLRRDLMGHRLTREEYGDGASLAHQQEELLRIAF